MKLRKILAFMVVMAMLLSNVTAYATETLTIQKYSINMLLNGSKVNVQNFILDGTTYVPIRAISELMGARVGWNQDTKTASIDYSNTGVTGEELLETVNINASDNFEVNLSKNLPQDIDIIALKNSEGKQLRAFVEVEDKDTIKIERFMDIQSGLKYYIDIRTKSGLTKKIELVTNSTVNLTTGEEYYKIAANPLKGFYYPYFIILGEDNKELDEFKDTLIVETNNEFLTSDNETSQKLVEAEELHGFSQSIGSGKYITIMTTFPRPNQDGDLYTHSLDRDTLLLDKEDVEELGRGNLLRIDLQYKAIIEDALTQIENNGKEMDDKVIAAGFSASADFANRFTLIHPEIVKGVVAGFMTTLPLEEYDGEELRFPLGVADLPELADKEFNEEDYREVEQFLFLGADDDNDPVYYDDGWDIEDSELYRELFGQEMQQRKAKIWELLKSEGYDKNIKFTLYKDLKHGYNDEVFDDIETFLENLD